MNRKTRAAQFIEEECAIIVTGRHVQITNSMKEYATEKVLKIERFGNKIIDVNVTMDIQKLEHRVDIVLRFSHLKVKSHASSDNMYASIDKAVDKLQAQLLKYKTRIQDHHAKALSSIDMNVNVLQAPSQQELLEVNDEIEEENQRVFADTYYPHQVVAKEVMPLKTLTQQEAIMKMELSLDVFLIYLSEEDQKLKIMYRRKDGNFAVIEPEF